MRKTEKIGRNNSLLKVVPLNFVNINLLRHINLSERYEKRFPNKYKIPLIFQQYNDLRQKERKKWMSWNQIQVVQLHLLKAKKNDKNKNSSNPK